MHGKGIKTFGSGTKFNGDKYDGEYNQDKMHGHGKYNWKNEM